MNKFFSRIKAAWRKAKQKKTHYQINDREYVLIGASAAAGAIISVMLSKIDFNEVKSLTGHPLADFLIYAALLSTFIIFIIRFVMKLLHYSEIFGEFQEILFNLKDKGER